MADGACQGDLHAPTQKEHIKELIRNLEITHINVTTEDVLTKIMENTPYAWTLNGTPLITSIQSLKEARREQTYRENRDNFAKNECTRTPKQGTFWKEATLEHANTSKKKANLTKDQTIKAIAITFDWKSDGRNRAKITTTDEETEQAAKCILCGEIDSQYHTLKECQEKELIQHRIDTDEKIDNFIRKCEVEDNEDNTPHIIRKYIKSSTSHKPLLGLFTATQQTQLAQLLNVNDIPRWEVYKLKNTLINIGSIYWHGAYRIITQKQKIERKRQGENTYQNTTKQPAQQLSLIHI